VNIVKVDITGPVGDAFDPGEDSWSAGESSATIGTETFATHRIYTGTNDEPTISWTALVSLTGPNGRGEDKINVGAIQTLTSLTNSATYLSSRTLSSNIEILTPLLDRASGQSTPWYQTTEGTGPMNGGPAAAFALYDIDVPELIVPLTYDKKATVALGDDVVIGRVLRFSFDLDICAQTTEQAMSADTVFTRLATGVWDAVFDASITWEENDFGYYSTTSFYGGVGIFASQQWQPITDGSRPPQLNDPVFSDKLKNEQFQ
jgi:hypothetical protein